SEDVGRDLDDLRPASRVAGVALAEGSLATAFDATWRGGRLPCDHLTKVAGGLRSRPPPDIGGLDECHRTAGAAVVEPLDVELVELLDAGDDLVNGRATPGRGCGQLLVIQAVAADGVVPQDRPHVSLRDPLEDAL